MGSTQGDPTIELQTLIDELTNVSKSFNPEPGLEGYKSRIEVITKAKQMISVMTDPSDMAFQHCTNMFELMAIRTLLSLHVLEKIPDVSISLQDLSAATGVQDSLLERLLRIVVGTGFIGQTSDLEYTHTKFSRAYTTFPGPGLFFQLIYDNSYLALTRFHEYLIDRGSRTEPEKSTFNPYTWVHKQDGKVVWEILAQDPERLKAFQMGLANMEASVPIVGFYDFGKLETTENRPILVDVGGGGGQSIIAIMGAHPNLASKPEKFILQDLPEQIALARTAGRLPEKVIKMDHDFYTAQPIKEAKAYYLRRIMHDYSDANCIKILRLLAEAMSADSVVLIADMVMSATTHEADLPAVAMDVAMLALGGKERTEEGFKKILEPAGLELVKVWRASFGAGALVEARLAGSAK